MIRRSALARLLSYAAFAPLMFQSRLLAAGSNSARGSMKSAWDVLEIATGDTLLVWATVAGTRVQAVLDSGSALSIISDSLAASLSLDNREQRTIRGMSGRALVHVIPDINITLGDVPRRLAFVYAADLTAVSSAFGRPIDLVLGLDMLINRSIALDFANRRFTLGPSGSFVARPGWTVLPLALGANGELVIRASVAGLPSVPLVFDLGSSTALMLSSTYVDEYGLIGSKLHSTAALAGVEGIRVANAFTLERADLGKLPVTAIPALSVENWMLTSAVGNIGLPLIAQFDVVLDVTARRLCLRLGDPLHRLPMLKDRSGLGLAPSPAALTVVHVAASSPAEKSGWAINDQIAAVNGSPIDATYTRGDLWRWRFGSAGTVAKLVTVAGETRELRLANYF